MTELKSKAAFTDRKFLVTIVFVTSLFMFWGIAITMADVLNTHFQATMSLSKFQSGFVQFAIFPSDVDCGPAAGTQPGDFAIWPGTRQRRQ